MSPNLFGIVTILRMTILSLAVFAILAWAANDPPLSLGSDVTDLAVVDAQGKPLYVRGLVRGRAILLVFLNQSSDADPCRHARALSQASIQEPIRRFLVLSRRFAPGGGCGADGVDFLYRPAPLPPAGSGAASLTAVIVDDAFYIRWRTDLAADSPDWPRLADGVNAWLQSRQTFEANCGHCHGMDGAQASSPDVKSLVGITRKYPEAEVLRLGSQFGGVDMTGWNDAKRESLLTYIRGL